MKKKRNHNERRQRERRAQLKEARQLWQDTHFSLQQQDTAETWELLRPFLTASPPSIDKLELCADICHTLGNFPDMFYAARRLTKLRTDVDDYMTLLEASVQLSLPSHMHYALKFLRKDWPGEEIIPNGVQMLESCESWYRETLASFQERFSELRAEDFVELTLAHEESMAELQAGRYESAAEIAGKLIQRFPYFSPAYNNHALGAVHAGGYLRAGDAIDAALAHDPESLFALGMQACRLQLLAQNESLQQTLEKMREVLKKLPEDDSAFRLLTAAGEAMAMLNQDQDVLSIHEKSVALKHCLKNLSRENEEDCAMISHFAAVAFARREDAKNARKCWLEAKKFSGREIIDENLADLQRKPGQRNGPWYFSVAKIIPDFVIQALREDIQHVPENKNKNKADSKRQSAAVLKSIQKIERLYPEFPRYLIKALWDGGPDARQFAKVFGVQYAHPDFVRAMVDFCKSPRGTDEYRMAISNQLLENGHIQPGIVKYFIEGEQRELLLCNFKITEEPRQDDAIPPRIEKEVNRAYYLLQEGDAEEAMRIYERILPSCPNAPSVHYNYAICLLQLKKREEYRRKIDEICQNFPEYIFGIGAQAGNFIGENRLDEAWKLVQKLMSWGEYHISEFRMVMNLTIALQVEMGQPDAAKAYYDMCRDILENYPLPPLEAYMSGELIQQWK